MNTPKPPGVMNHGARRRIGKPHRTPLQSAPVGTVPIHKDKPFLRMLRIWQKAQAKAAEMAPTRREP